MIEKLKKRDFTSSTGGGKFVHRYYQEMFHAWTHVPEWVGRMIGKSKKDGGEGTAVEIKWEVYNELSDLLKERFSL